MRLRGVSIVIHNPRATCARGNGALLSGIVTAFMLVHVAYIDLLLENGTLHHWAAINRGRMLTKKPASPSEIWIAAAWALVRELLPPPPARVVEIGCGPRGGFIPALRQAGYEATGIDPEAPHGSAYRQFTFEGYRPDDQVDAVIASVSLHHVDQPGLVLEHVRSVLRPDGIVVVIEWLTEEFDEATARWCFAHGTCNPALPGAWLGKLREKWKDSQRSWDDFFGGWLENHHIHTAAAIYKELEARFDTIHESRGAYYFQDLVNADYDSETVAIDRGEIRAGCLRYAGRRREDYVASHTHFSEEVEHGDSASGLSASPVYSVPMMPSVGNPRPSR